VLQYSVVSTPHKENVIQYSYPMLFACYAVYLYSVAYGTALSCPVPDTVLHGSVRELEAVPEDFGEILSQATGTHCTVPYCTALCTALYRTAPYRTALCTTMYRSAVYTTLYRTLPRCAGLCTAQGAELRYTILHCTVHCTALHRTSYQNARYIVP
jgi:hypothetical protein